MEKDVAAANAELFGDGPAPLFTDKELEALRAEARGLLREEEKKAARTKLIEEEKLRLKREDGLRTGIADKDEPVTLLVDVAEYCDRIVLNGKEYFHGYSYTVPRHVADGMREAMQRTHRHQMTLDGKDMAEQYRRTQNVTLSPNAGAPA